MRGDGHGQVRLWDVTSGKMVRELGTHADHVKAVAFRPDGKAVASGGDDTVYRLDPDGDVVGAYNGGGIDAPWAVRIDDVGNVWVANVKHDEVMRLDDRSGRIRERLSVPGHPVHLAVNHDGVWVGTRFIATPEARGVRGYKETLLRSHEDDTVVTKAYTGKTCRVIANSYTQEYEDGARAIQRFPAQVLQSIQDGANHLGGDEVTPGVDPDREFFPAGQGVGSIDALVPAGDLVRQIVDEAEAVLAKIR